MTSLHRIIAIEDNPETLVDLCTIIDSLEDTLLVATAASVAQGTKLVRQHSFDLAIVDLHLSDGYAFDLIHEIRQTHSAGIVAVTVFGDEEIVIQAIQSGASGYILKNATTAAIRQGIKDALQGFSPISPGIAGYILQKIQAPRFKLLKRERNPLTKRELEVLALLARGYSYQEVADRCCISTNTVRFHIKRIYDKLKVRSRGEAVFTAFNNGLLNLE